ncbi:hypothetical protein [Paraburkholderia sp. BL10I2N1]|uniref:hypothetical protein n=1 Tax=Paraburkholderia sp. BL10I2N1 TaxID=1938796 RepID=UPI00105CD24F|nr:hypothetical protein [Paraburkholderia sp. BL10I2N1]TDN62599.1 hypothetical protein B0G77_6182 [Paraburkholderia sp. BL10I2N1]
MNVIELARESGMAVILDGRIGREEYQSVCCSLSALQRFADALCAATVKEYFCPVSPHTVGVVVAKQAIAQPASSRN